MRIPLPRRPYAAVLLVVVLAITSLAPALASAAAWLGVATETLSHDVRAVLGLEDQGVRVSTVVPDGPAAKAGLKVGDILLEFAGQPIDSAPGLIKMVTAKHEGDAVELRILRNGEHRTVSVTLDMRPSDAERRAYGAPMYIDLWRSAQPETEGDVRLSLRMPGPKGESRELLVDPDALSDQALEALIDSLGERGHQPGGLRPMFIGMLSPRLRLGVRTEALSPDLASALSMSSGSGSLVLHVRSGSPADRAGIRAGDVIVAVNGHPAPNPEMLSGVISVVRGTATISFSRQGRRADVEADLGTPPQSAFDLMPEAPEGSITIVHPTVNRDTVGLQQQLNDLKQQVRDLRRRLDQSRSH